MIHPLSSLNEIEYYLDIANSKYILTVDLFEEKVIEAARKVDAKKIIIAPQIPLINTFKSFSNIPKSLFCTIYSPPAKNIRFISNSFIKLVYFSISRLYL